MIYYSLFVILNTQSIWNPKTQPLYQLMHQISMQAREIPVTISWLWANTIVLVHALLVLVPGKHSSFVTVCLQRNVSLMDVISYREGKTTKLWKRLKTLSFRRQTVHDGKTNFTSPKNVFHPFYQIQLNDPIKLTYCYKLHSFWYLNNGCLMYNLSREKM